jgi:hypothetical protein
MNQRRILALVLVLAALAAFVSRPGGELRATPTPPLPLADVTPVLASKMVNVFVDRVLAAGESFAVYKVPPTKRLVLTQAGIANSSGSFDTQLVQRLNGVTTIKLTSNFEADAVQGIGIAFAPDSSVELVNPRSTQDRATLTIFGYLAPTDHWPAVNVADLFDTNGTATVPFGQQVKLADVPPDRWLVLTSAQFTSSGFSILEDDGGTITVKPRPFSKESMSIGLAFHPGSSIYLRNDTPFTPGNYRWLLYGYFERS